MTTAVSNLLSHPAFLALIPVMAIWIAYMRTSKKQNAMQININGNMHTALEKIDSLTELLVAANETIARLERLLGLKNGATEAVGQVGKSKNGAVT